MRRSLLSFLSVLFLLSSLAFLAAQETPSGGMPTTEQAMQNNLRMLNSIRANPQSKSQALQRLKERLDSRGISDADSRLSELGKIFDEAIAMSKADFEKNQQQLLSRIMTQMKSVPSTIAAGQATNKVPWIDVHDHLVGGSKGISGAVEAAVAAMDQYGTSMMIVMPTPNDGSHKAADCEIFVTAIRKYPKRFAFLGGGNTLNIMLHRSAKQTTLSESARRDFEKKAEDILKTGASGFGEMAVRHLSLHGSGHPYEEVAADHPLLLLLADIAARNDVPIDIHFDMASEDIKLPSWLDSASNPPTLKANLPAFERLLEHNPKAKMIWAHAGSDNIGHWTVELSRKMLEKHPNLYMSLRLGPGHAPQNFPLTRDGQLRPDWLQLLQDFPTRFVIGDDQFLCPADARDGIGASLSGKAPLCRNLTNVFLNALPSELARKIASENAMTLYKLKSQGTEQDFKTKDR
ncbi:MAG: hypothetical protein A2X49_09320 [Lentisphaerae bacterium GWF2_52_8]|nr:MAG: hypothetical protein A2X49_09320 [Lentisphaerae bacterium GWF2_52_8]